MKPAQHLLNTIFQQFETYGTVASIQPFGSGHINDTFLVRTTKNSSPNYVLQRINHSIFKNVPALMNNVVLVTQHLQKKLSAIPNVNLSRECLTVVFTREKQSFVQDEQGYYWVCYLFIEGSQSHDVVLNAKQAYEGGKTLGRFLDLVSDFPCDLLHETLPNFHHVGYRLDNFMQAHADDKHKRIAQCQDEIDFVNAHADEMKYILHLGDSGKIPQRITHNDTKFNNVLLDEHDNGLCVIDLDTVMPGYIHYDLSDAVRTVANTSVEDEPDLNKIAFNTDLFAAFSRGFLGEIKQSLTIAEIDSLALSLPLLPFLMGLRFLTDYLQGDVYYKTHFPGHNLQRARAQFQFIRCIKEKMPVLSAIIQQSAN
jgi:Ser/Thr protein kinase RdoA (MazF antagonist)